MSLIIADEEFWRGAARIRDIADELMDIFTLYSKIINELTRKGLCDVAVNNVLVEKTNLLTQYKIKLSSYTMKIEENTNTFIANIDKADSFLY